MKKPFGPQETHKVTVKCTNIDNVLSTLAVEKEWIFVRTEIYTHTLQLK